MTNNVLQSASSDVMHLNRLVRFQLNEAGKEAYRNYIRIRQSRLDNPPGIIQPLDADADGYSTLPLWEVMAVFGPCFMNGRTSPFVDNVLIS